jgi:hypothetical protein
MMSCLTTMLTCRWSGRRAQRYLDSDPAALLGAWSQRHVPDAAMIARVRLGAELVMVEDLG